MKAIEASIIYMINFILMLHVYLLEKKLQAKNKIYTANTFRQFFFFLFFPITSRRSQNEKVCLVCFVSLPSYPQNIELELIEILVMKKKNFTYFFVDAPKVYKK